MKKIVVVGSINMDIVTNMQRYPVPGETIYGTGFGTFPGGKGANQAVAAGKLGSNVVFLGMVGDDLYGTAALKSMQKAGVDTTHVEVLKDTNTGIACIWVSGEGENCIVLDTGANGKVDVTYIKRHLAAFDDCGMVLMQFEIPLETVLWTASFCKQKGIPVMLDPAPAMLCTGELIAASEYVTPNETEILKVSGCKTAGEGIKRLLELGAAHVMCKEGAAGCTLIDNDVKLHCGGFKVKVVDTTAAGDSFNAGFAVALLSGADTAEAMEYANAVGALAVTKLGAQSAMPTDLEVREFLNKQKNVSGGKNE